MKHILLLTFFAIMSVNPGFCQDTIKLPKPITTGGKGLMDALLLRQTQRDFIESSLEPQQMSNLLWAAYGINRSESGKRTAPSAMNRQEFDLYVVQKSGAFLFSPENNFLIPVAKGDLRKYMGKQDFVAMAACVLVYVADFDRMGRMSDEDKVFYSAVDCGYISQNVYLFCASEELKTVVLGYIDREQIAKYLLLKESQHIILTQPVGY